MNIIRIKVTSIAGITGGTITTLLGGRDTVLETLAMFMLLDIILGCMLALVFKSSIKTETGAYSSSVFTQGLFKKAGILTVVIVAVYMDKLTGTTYIRNVVCYGFIANESISILETVGKMGVPIPSLLKDAINVLTTKGKVD